MKNMSCIYNGNSCFMTDDDNKQCRNPAFGCRKCFSAPYPSPRCIGHFKLRLLGGSPIWSIANAPAFSKDGEKREGSESRPKKESHLSKVSILKKKPAKVTHTLSVDCIGSLSTISHEDLESPSTSGSFASLSTGHNVISRVVDRKLHDFMEEKKRVDPSLINSPEGKQLSCKDIVDYDDDNDNNILSTEVSLSSVAQQNDGEDITVMESFSESNIGNVISSPLDPDQMVSDEYLLFHGNMVVDVSDELHCSDKDETEGNSSQDSMQVMRSPTTSEDDYIMQNKIRRKSLLSDENFFKISESNVNEEVTTESSVGSQSNEPMETQGTELVTDQVQKANEKLSDEQISTKEDFEELIDERTRKGFLIKPLNTQFQQQNLQARSTTATFTAQPAIFTTNDFNKKAADRVPQKLSLMPIQATQRIETATGTILQKQNITTIPASGPKLTSIILHNSPMRKSVLGVPNLVANTSSAITVINASTSQIASILPSHFTVPLISASAVRQLPNVKVIDKPSSSLSLTTQSNCLPKNIFEEDYSSNKGISDEKKHKQVPNEGFRPTQEHKLSIHRIQGSVVKLIDSQGEVTNLKPGETIEKVVASSSQHTSNNDQNKSDSIPVITHQKMMERSGQQTTTVFPKFIQKITTTNLLSDQVKDAPNTVVLREAPELKMTAHVVHQKEPVMHITTRTENNDDFVNSMSDETKSVVISIPSPTPSQEQMLDNIALQALESTRKDGKGGVESEFQTFEDMLDMIENITNDTPTVLPEPKRNETHEVKISTNKPVVEKPFQLSSSEVNKSTVDAQISVAVSNVTRPSVIPQLSPLSQPTELTTNIANVSQQLRSLLSSLHTTTVSTNTETRVKSMTQKLVTTTTLQAATPTLRIVDESGNFMTSSEHKNKLAMSQNLVKTTYTSSHQIPIQAAGTITSVSVAVTSTPASTNTASHTVQNTSHAMQNTSHNVQNTSHSVQNILFTRCVGSSSNLQERSKPALLEAVSKSDHQTQFEIRKSVSTPVSTIDVTKPSFSLAAILQTHPVSTAKSFDNAPVSTSQSHLDNTSSVIQSGPSVSHSPVYTTSIRSISLPQALERVQASEANLIAANLKLKYMRSNVIQSKQPETLQTNVIKFEDIKKEPMDTNSETKVPVTTSSNVEITSSESSHIPASISYTTASTTRDDDSQNVLLKKLLQNTACASTQTSPSLSTTITTSSLKQDCNSNSLLLESQLIKSAPSISSILPPTTSQSQTKIQQKFSIVSRESPTAVPAPTLTTVPSTSAPITVPSSPVIESTKTPELISMEVIKPVIPRSVSHHEESSSPKIPKIEQTDPNIQTSPMQIKKELQTSEPHMMLPQEVKKELLDETSQNSENSEAGGRTDFPIKEEPDSVDPDKLAYDQKEELKKQKRRLYQQKRRQNQILNKEMAGQPKKRARKSSKVEEDYDSFIDGVLAQLRSFPAMNILEPQFHRNFNVVPVHGSGDLTKLGSKDYDYRCGDLMGNYGNASIPSISDFYSTKPYGDCEPSPKKPSTTQREFYDDEFPLIKFETDDEKQFDLFCREDSPDSIVSNSSCDSPVDDLPKFMGLKLIETEEEEEIRKKRSTSPVIPIVTPIPIRLKAEEAVESALKQQPMDVDKENIDTLSNVKVLNEKPKANGNITVTLTLTSSAAEDIMGVLRDLANILHIPAPTGYQILERTTTPPSQKYGMYKTKDKDKDPVDIQSILNGAAKFCKHCDVIILNKMVRKKVSELPFLAKDSELLCENGELSFCSSSCYMQFSLLHRSPTITEAKALEIIDHLSQKNKEVPQRVQSHITASSSHDMMKNYPNTNQYKSFMDTDINYPHLDFKVQCQSGLKEQKYTSIDSQTSKPRLYKGTRYKIWTPHCLQPSVKYRKPSDKEIIELLYRLGITVTPAKIPEDTRKCVFCQGVGDGVADGPARLLNFDVDKWVHLNCGLWSDGVYETVNGALMNLENALQQSLLQTCVNCNRLGATIRCFKTRCTNVYHLTCAVKDGCVFFKNKTMYCMLHVPKNEKDNELTTLSVSRRVYVNRDENRQVAAVMHHSDTNNIMRVGSLILLSVGQLLPHQLQNFHNANHIYPIGYKIIRFYWSMRKMNKRCRYICSIHENGGRPEFKVLIQEPPEEDIEFKGSTPKEVWDSILENLAALRKKNYCVQFFPKFVVGEDLFGLTEPAVVRVLESLPGIDTLTDYKFKYGRNPLLELPLAINPSGCARTEGKTRGQFHWKRPHTQRTTGTSSRPLFSVAPPVPNIGFLGESCPYSKQFVHSKSSQYKKMKQEWRNNVFLARSKIQGLGLYAARDLEKHTMVIEYIGELIRTELAETREKKYEAKNRGIYMFRLDEDRVVDATLSGGLARYINHSCNPNCVAEIVEVDRDLRIIIFAKRRIQRGEELAYDYKFDIEDDQHKISCMCGAPNCRKWMN